MTILRWIALPFVVIIGFSVPLLMYEWAIQLEYLPGGFWDSVAEWAAHILGSLLAIRFATFVSPPKNKVLGTVLASLAVGFAIVRLALGGEVSWWVVVIVALSIPAAIGVAKDERSKETQDS